MAASKALMELRVVMCQNSTGSAGVRYAASRSCLSRAHAPTAVLEKLPLPHLCAPREFFAKNYAALKAANAKLPILLREGQGATAKVTAVYGGLSISHPQQRPLPTAHSLRPLLEHRVWCRKELRCRGAPSRRGGQQDIRGDEGLSVVHNTCALSGLPFLWDAA